MKHILVVNGLEAPMLRQFGCECDRCASPERQANTSVSLLGLNGSDEAEYHVLVDVGIGVVDSLLQNPYLYGRRARLDWLLLTHWHPDHTLGINQLCVSYHLTRQRSGRDTAQVPVWCRAGTAAWLQRERGYEWQTFLQPHISEENEPPGRLLPPLDLGIAGLKVTPVTVSHFGADRSPDDAQQVQYSCAAFIVETAVAKTVLLWDIDSENEWLVSPQTEVERTAVAHLAHADRLFIDTAFWRAKKHRATHPSFDNVQRIVANLQPKETLLVHLSGHPDGAGNPGWGWTNAQWTAAAQEVWQQKQLPGSVRVPAIGEQFEL
ncbi:MAG: MBL fold metallo-hydrolase [Ardenticatenaceae bacterium]|nr:MBL fold metallo-hydrolase [Anaerolineales bacterium]MCB8920120.1 MBL fold metallo-hydrolase [Ardenticatenaceae bacterium]